ncbi:unnamed protein product [Protopolystoma xenopodis]|uniref:Uncharacterized protein n=1 Tax=Protopolystoma xenopodis TaxID=117903 RepID=A0A448XCY5_9PLAT|nr:unnamed protein product [Protopolystoma xenopodis]
MLAHLHHHMDPILSAACQNEIGKFCGVELAKAGASSETSLGNPDTEASVIECLKSQLFKHQLADHSDCQAEVLRLVSEERVDVHVDPILYQACSAELRTVCSSVSLYCHFIS